MVDRPQTSRAAGYAGASWVAVNDDFNHVDLIYGVRE
jgi:hypothetical protein